MTSHNRKFLIFQLQGQNYALDLDQVAEVGDPSPISPIPLAPAYYSGALNFHGDIVAVMDLARFLSVPGSIPSGKIIVLHRETASLAFLVDTIIRIAPESEISIYPPADTGFAAATLALTDGEATLLNLEALIKEAENSLQKK